MKKTETAIAGDMLTDQETAALECFRREHGQRFRGCFFKHHNPEGEIFWIYRPLQGIGGASTKYGRLENFLTSLVQDAPSPAIARPQAPMLIAG